VWIRQGKYAGLKFPVVPGSDGAGVVIEAGAGVDRAWLDREVIINPSFDWGADARAQGPDFTILGLPRQGTLAERIAVPAAQLARKPAHLSWVEAAALPLAALTAWRALFTRAGLKAGERLLVTGTGGGAAVFALQFGCAAGAKVYATSSSAEKLVAAERLGACGGALYSAPGWADGLAAAAGAFDVILDSAGGPQWGELLKLAAPGGRLVFFGATAGDPPAFPMRAAFWKQLSILGTTMGSPHDFSAMLAMVQEHGIRPVVSQVYPLADGARAFELMENGGQFGKIVVSME
jgi:NADPH:quinone reductase-like Zn-dependent oxidoreductase